jgi:hypothetical protein
MTTGVVTTLYTTITGVKQDFGSLANDDQNTNPNWKINWATTGSGSSPVAPANTTPPTLFSANLVTGTQVSVGMVNSQGNFVNVPGIWTGFPAPIYTYVWKSAGVTIPGVVGQTYVTSFQDVGNSITCVVTATNTGGSASVTTASVGPFTTNIVSAPVNTVLPVITGSLSSGSTLTCSTGTWTGAPVPTYSYQWTIDLLNGYGPQLINDREVGFSSNLSTYVLQDSQVGYNIGCIVTAGNSVSNVNKSATEVGPVTSTSAAAPANTVAPVVSIVNVINQQPPFTLPTTPTVNCVLSSTSGTWTGHPAPIYTYQWFNTNGAITAQTKNTYTVQTSDLGLAIHCVVSATNATSTVTQASNTLATTIAAGYAPNYGTLLPVLSGSPVVGQVLTSTTGTATASPAASYTYQWYSSVYGAISGATSSTYTVQSIDSGTKISCEVTASNLYGATLPTAAIFTVTAASGETTTYDYIQIDETIVVGSVPVNTLAPVVSGTMLVGSTLTTTTGTWTGSPTFSYQWYDVTSGLISGATSNTYVLQNSNITHNIYCAVTGSANLYYPLTDTTTVGSATADSNTVNNVNTLVPYSLTAVTIAGSSVHANTLTATPGTWSGSPTPAITHQWYDSVSGLISGATGTTYLTTVGEIGHNITCQETATNTNGAVTVTSNAIGPLS